MAEPNYNLLNTATPAEAALAPIKGMGAVNALQAQQLQNQAAQFEIQNALAEQEAYKQAGGDVAAAQRNLMGAGLGRQATALGKSVAETQQAQMKAMAERLPIQRDMAKDMAFNPSDQNIQAHLQDQVIKGWITPQEAQMRWQRVAGMNPQQREQFFLNGATKAEDVLKQMETRRHNRVTEGISGGHLALAQQREARLAAGQTGTTLTPEQNEALFGENGAVTRGLIDPMKINSRNAKMWADAYTRNPNANVAQISQDVKAAESVVKAFASGVEGRKVTAFNTAIDHLDTLEQLGAALKNNDVRLFNELSNRLGAATGQAAPTSFAQASKIVGGEISKAIVPGVGTGKEREEAAHAFNTANSPEQLAGAIATSKKLMGGQLRSLEHQYQRGTKRTDFADTMLTPGARKAYQSAGATAPAATRPAGVGADWQLMTDASGNKAWVSPDKKSFKEVK